MSLLQCVDTDTSANRNASASAFAALLAVTATTTSATVPGSASYVHSSNGGSGTDSQSVKDAAACLKDSVVEAVGQTVANATATPSTSSSHTGSPQIRNPELKPRLEILSPFIASSMSYLLTPTPYLPTGWNPPPSMTECYPPFGGPKVKCPISTFIETGDCLDGDSRWDPRAYTVTAEVPPSSDGRKDAKALATQPIEAPTQPMSRPMQHIDAPTIASSMPFLLTPTSTILNPLQSQPAFVVCVRPNGVMVECPESRGKRTAAVSTVGTVTKPNMEAVNSANGARVVPC
jgi:hypothetical protein